MTLKLLAHVFYRLFSLDKSVCIFKRESLEKSFLINLFLELFDVNMTVIEVSCRFDVN